MIKFLHFLLSYGCLDTINCGCFDKFDRPVRRQGSLSYIFLNVSMNHRFLEHSVGHGLFSWILLLCSVVWTLYFSGHAIKSVSSYSLKYVIVSSGGGPIMNSSRWFVTGNYFGCKNIHQATIKMIRLFVFNVCLMCSF